MLGKGDPTTIKMYQDYGHVMIAFPTLSERDIRCILTFIEIRC